MIVWSCDRCGMQEEDRVEGLSTLPIGWKSYVLSEKWGWNSPTLGSFPVPSCGTDVLQVMHICSHCVTVGERVPNYSPRIEVQK